MENQSNYFQLLPHEIIVNICNYIDDEDLGKLALIYKQFDFVVNDKIFWCVRAHQRHICDKEEFFRYFNPMFGPRVTYLLLQIKKTLQDLMKIIKN